MAKRKTRQQKIIADLKRQISSSQTTSVTLEKKSEKHEKLTTATFKLPIIPTLIENKKAISTLTNTEYLKKDLRKTGLLTASIVIAQLILLFILKNHVITLGGLIY